MATRKTLEGYAWDFLRRNEEYQKDYAKYAATPKGYRRLNAARELCEKYGLHPLFRPKNPKEGGRIIGEHAVVAISKGEGDNLVLLRPKMYSSEPMPPIDFTDDLHLILRLDLRRDIGALLKTVEEWIKTEQKRRGITRKRNRALIDDDVYASYKNYLRVLDMWQEGKKMAEIAEKLGIELQTGYDWRDAAQKLIYGDYKKLLDSGIKSKS